MKGVAPAVWRVIVIVVSSAWVAPARLVKTMKAEPMMISEHAFIAHLLDASFYKKNARGTSEETHSRPANLRTNG